MHSYIEFVIILFLFAKGFCQDPNYCDLHPRDILCSKKLREDGSDFNKEIPTLDQEDEIVDWHNKIRRKVALGIEKRNSLPLAANMMMMEWDPKLAEIAQRAANHFVFGHDCAKCRGVLDERFALGQNIASAIHISRDHFDFVKLIKIWYEMEVESFDASAVESFNLNGALAHYSQLIWWNTRAVGCGGSSYRSPNHPGYHFIVFCNYGPGGNVHGAKIYITGENCSKCPKGTICDTTYDGLCAIAKKGFHVSQNFHTDKKQIGLDPNSRNKY